MRVDSHTSSLFLSCEKLNSVQQIENRNRRHERRKRDGNRFYTYSFGASGISKGKIFIYLFTQYTSYVYHYHTLHLSFTRSTTRIVSIPSRTVPIGVQFKVQSKVYLKYLEKLVVVINLLCGIFRLILHFRVQMLTDGPDWS